MTKNIKVMDNVKPMNEAAKNKHEFNKLVKTAKSYLDNLRHFIDSVCLLLLAGFAYMFCKKVGLSERDVYIFQFAAIFIGLRGAWEFVKTFKR
jgi:hypothetical protein